MCRASALNLRLVPEAAVNRFLPPLPGTMDMLLSRGS